MWPGGSEQMPPSGGPNVEAFQLYGMYREAVQLYEEPGAGQPLPPDEVELWSRALHSRLEPNAPQLAGQALLAWASKL